MLYQLWYGRMLNPRHYIVHSGHDLMKHAEILTGGMALTPSFCVRNIPRPRSSSPKTCGFVDYEPIQRWFDSIPLASSYEAATQTHIFNRIITELL